MQHGWVAATDTNGAKFVQLDKEDDESLWAQQEMQLFTTAAIRTTDT